MSEYSLSAVFPSLFVHGHLRAVNDTARRHLRPVGESLTEIVRRTDGLLTELTLPGVHVFRGVRVPRPYDAAEPRIGHVAVLGRALVLIESVVWPPGRYSVLESGQVVCDGIRTGQSVLQLMAAVHQWVVRLPGHRVSGLVVVHGGGHPGTALGLPDSTAELAWARPAELLPTVSARLGGPSVGDIRALAFLWLATRGAAPAPGGTAVKRGKR